MTGKFGTQTVLLSYCEWDDYNGKVFVDEAAFRDYFDKPWFLESWDEAGIDALMATGFLGFNVVEVIGT